MRGDNLCCPPCMSRRAAASRLCTAVAAKGPAIVDMDALFATPGAWLVLRGTPSGSYQYLKKEQRCIWVDLDESPEDLLRRLHCHLMDGAVLSRAPQYTHSLAELAADHHDYIKASTEGAAVCVMATVPIEEALLSPSRLFTCFQDDSPDGRLRELGVFHSVGGTLAYTKLTRSWQPAAGEEKVVASDTEAVFFDGVHYFITTTQDAHAACTGTGDAPSVAAAEMAVFLIHPDGRSSFVEAGHLPKDKRRQLIAASAQNQAQAPPLELRVGRTSSLFKRAIQVDVCNSAGATIWCSDAASPPLPSVAWLQG